MVISIILAHYLHVLRAFLMPSNYHIDKLKVCSLVPL